MVAVYCDNYAKHVTIYCMRKMRIAVVSRQVSCKPVYPCTYSSEAMMQTCDTRLIETHRRGAVGVASALPQVLLASVVNPVIFGAICS